MEIDVLAIGELLVDIISDEYVTTIADAKNFKFFQGGSPANVCANLNWLKVNAELVSCVGNDSIGKYITDSLSKIGIKDTYIKRSISHPTTIVLVSRSSGTPDFIAYRMADTQIDSVDEELISRSSILHTTAFALSKNPSQKSIMDALTFAVRKGKVISVDWNYAPQLWGGGGESIFARLCTMLPLLKISMDDVTRFSGRALTIEDAKTFLNGFATTLTCLTCGKDGVWFKTKGQAEWLFEPAIPVDEVKDTTGAGDAFWSGFLAHYVKRCTLPECIHNGLIIASRKIQKVGPIYQ